jgi:hypothetical protein
MADCHKKGAAGADFYRGVRTLHSAGANMCSTCLYQHPTTRSVGLVRNSLRRSWRQVGVGEQIASLNTGTSFRVLNFASHGISWLLLFYPKF